MANAAETYINCDGDTNPHLSLHFSSFSDGLLKNFIAGTKFPPKFADTLTSEEDEGVELSLGLSLNGRFGSVPTRDKNLSRSSSIPELLKPSSSKDEGTSVSVTWTPPILRTSSLPMEVQEECRKRKQMQSLRRMEAKRKRTEKQRNMMNKRVVTEEDHHSKIMGNSENDNVLFASQGSGSSGISEFDSQSIQANEYTEEGSPQLDKPKPKPKPKQTINVVSTDEKSSMRKVLLEMPCVSTTGEGPNGRRIEGFLYRYRKGEEVKIVCVCHGSFLSPAEFVKHAGGADVLHPLKHIVVTPSPFAS